jgi:hypothetical protein
MTKEGIVRPDIIGRRGFYRRGTQCWKAAGVSIFVLKVGLGRQRREVEGCPFHGFWWTGCRQIRHDLFLAGLVLFALGL